MAASAFIAAMPEFFTPLGDIDLDSVETETLCTAASPNSTETCDKSNNSTVSLISASSWPAVIMFSLYFIFLNVGASIKNTLLFPLIHDNVGERESSIYFALLFMGRLTGPIVGFTLGAVSSGLYVDLINGPPDGISNTDPKWIGAWYLGFFIICGCLVFLSFLILLFPDDMRSNASNSMRLRSLKPTTSDLGSSNPGDSTSTLVSGEKHKYTMFQSIWLTITNSAVMLFALGRVVDMWFVSGLFKFLPKYIEIVFNQSASATSIVVGACTSVGLLIGLVIGGSAIKYLKLQPRHIMLAAAVINFIIALSSFGMAAINCGDDQLYGLDSIADHPLPKIDVLLVQKEYSCSADCACSDVYSPVCDVSRNMTFFSACTVGCSPSSLLAGGNASSKVYQSCTCAPDLELVSGECPRDCKQSFILFIIVFTIGATLLAIPMPGLFPVLFVAVKKELKSMAQGMTNLFCSGLGWC